MLPGFLCMNVNWGIWSVVEIFHQQFGLGSMDIDQSDQYTLLTFDQVCDPVKDLIERWVDTEPQVDNPFMRNA
jgi:hypothetical protein